MATVQQVAERAGVSAATVSHVTNNTRFVSPELRARVHAAMDELDYRPNALARSLRRGETRTLGLIVPESSNPFFAEVAQAVELAAFDRGYSVILCNSEGSPTKERLHLDVLLTKQVDGVILMSTGAEDALSQLVSGTIPIVIVDRDMPNMETDLVLADNRHGGYLATRHLIGLGHRRIGLISGPPGITLSEQRISGYMGALAEAGLAPDDTLLTHGDFHFESGRSGALILMNRPDPPTAVFACNDLMAIGVRRAAAEIGLQVPEDLSVVGFDDIQLASFTTPSLTTVAQPKAEMGRQAVRLLLGRMADRNAPAIRLVLLPDLVMRESSAARPSRSPDSACRLTSSRSRSLKEVLPGTATAI